MVRAHADDDRRAPRQHEGNEPLGKTGLRSRPAGLPAHGRGHRNDNAVAQPRERTDVRRRNEVGERGQDALRALGRIHLLAIGGADRQHAIGAALFEVAARPQQTRDAPVGFVVTGKQRIEDFGVAVALGRGDDPRVGDIFRGHHGADRVGVFDGEVGDRRNGVVEVAGSDRLSRLPHPARENAMAAAIGMKRPFERKALLRPQARMIAHEGEVADVIAR